MDGKWWFAGPSPLKSLAVRDAERNIAVERFPFRIRAEHLVTVDGVSCCLFSPNRKSYGV
jgi:hypothetical protein